MMLFSQVMSDWDGGSMLGASASAKRVGSCQFESDGEDASNGIDSSIARMFILQRRKGEIDE